MLSINDDEIVTVSDDCTLKFWSKHKLKAKQEIMTETITCITVTGMKNELIVAGCHSGNFLFISVYSKEKKNQLNMAHYNLIRVITSLERLKHKYFVSADVCGILKVWNSTSKPSEHLSVD